MAKKTGYDSPVLYHGTLSFGFTEFDLNKMDDGRSIFLTSSKEIASTYSGVDNLKKIENIIKEPETKEKIKEIYTKFQIAMDNHDIEGCFKAHEAIHDYDYWIINYPVYFETYPPADWGGIDTYFGTIE